MGKFCTFFLIRPRFIRNIDQMHKRLLTLIILILLVPGLIGFSSMAMPFGFHSYWRSDIWQVVSDDLVIYKPYANYQRVQKQIHWYRKQQDYIYQLTRNAKPYIYYVLQQTRKRGLPAEIALLPMVESDYNPFTYSNKGATGLWQLMPETASGFGLVINWWYDGRRDVVASTNAALNQLKYLHDYFHNWLLAFAAYNAGEGAVAAAINYNKRHHRPTDFWSLPLPEETKIYVPKLLALAAIIEHPAQYDLRLSPIVNKPFFKSVQLTKQVNFTHLAMISKSSLKTMRYLNPGFRRSKTMPFHSYNLLIPIGKVSEDHSTQLAVNSNKIKSSIAVINSKSFAFPKLLHAIQPKDSLQMLASRYDHNQTDNKAIRMGENLLLPTAEAEPIINKKDDQSISEDNIKGPKRITYTMKRHETLKEVARRFHVTADDIWFWNKFNNNTTLKANQVLTIWVSNKHHSIHASTKTHHRTMEHHIRKESHHYAKNSISFPSYNFRDKI